MTEPTPQRALRQIDEEHWADDLPEDGDLPKPIAEAIELLNIAIREHGDTACYVPSNRRVTIHDTQDRAAAATASGKPAP
jgi:hypothetical protein